MKNNLIDKNISKLKKLCVQYQVTRLDIFGSACTDRFDPTESDLDFLVDFLPLPPGKHADCYFDLLSALQDLFGHSIDLVEVKAIQNPYFQESIEKTRIMLYAA
ncbi:nucleotidyltransferase domain-containing protein [bacterium]|nr:nucleotidyltransferase domain-containing protein [bacterium]